MPSGLPNYGLAKFTECLLAQGLDHQANFKFLPRNEIGYARAVQTSLLFLFIAITFLATYPAEAQRGGGGGRGKGGTRIPDAKNPVEVINPFAPDAEPVLGVRRRIEAIERYMYRRLEGGSLEKRVHRLETRLIPWEHPSTDNNLDSLDKRVDHLWSVLAAANAKKLHDEASSYKNID